MFLALPWNGDNRRNDLMLFIVVASVIVAVFIVGFFLIFSEDRGGKTRNRNLRGCGAGGERSPKKSEEDDRS
jgi:hypothetical protein